MLLDKAFGVMPLTRAEKDRIAEIMYGVFGAQNSTYKLSGWGWPMYLAKQQIRRILVSFTYEPNNYRTYYAPDKTSLRKVLSSVHQMVYASDDDQKSDKIIEVIRKIGHGGDGVHEQYYKATRDIERALVEEGLV